MTKQEKSRELEQKLTEAQEKLRTYRENADTEFQGSRLYKRMEEEINTYRVMERAAVMHLETDLYMDRKSYWELKTVKADNARLCAEHGVAYWEGMTRTREDVEFDELNARITKLEAVIAAKDKIIEQLKGIISDQEKDRWYIRPYAWKSDFEIYRKCVIIRP